MVFSDWIYWVFSVVMDWVWIPLAVTYFGVILTILLENRNVSKSFSYIFLLIFFPIIGLVIFYFFGRDYRKNIKFRLKGENDKKTSKEFRQRLLKQQESMLNNLEDNFSGLSRSARLLFNVENSLTLTGNRASLLVNGEHKFPEFFQVIQAATHHIHIEYYILSEDSIGNQLVEILIAKAKEGVEVRLVVDGVGSAGLKKIPGLLKRNGVKFEVFMPVTFKRLASPNYRNHRKILIVDGRTGFIGGINLSDKYLNNGKYNLYWRDTHLKIEGPAVGNLQLNFKTTWEYLSNEILPFESPYFEFTTPTSDETPISIVSSGPTSMRPHGMDSMVSLIYNANKSIRITNPYFIPSEELSGSLIVAALSGIEVSLILPDVADSFLVQRASYSYFKPLLTAGVKIYKYQKGFLHAKTMTVDDQVSMVGSFNTDIRSFYVNLEASAIVYDKNLTAALNSLFIDDLQESQVITLAEWKKRSLINKLIDSICRLFTPIL